MTQATESIKISGMKIPVVERVLSPDALRFLAALQRKFNSTRLALLQQRKQRQILINEGHNPTFLPETKHIREDLSWTVASTPKDLQKRHVEITGPTERKMLINALNSGADVFMADFEDANSPTWQNMIEGQNNLFEAIRGTISFQSSDGKQYALKDNPAVLMVRPRGWHLHEKHLLIDGEPISASLFDFGLYFFHNAKALIEKGSGPYFYLPKLENHHEAKLWNDVFVFAQQELGIPKGTIRATVLLETILAAFEMEEILYVLREHSAGLNAGRWDYIFSAIKKFQQRENFLLPDRSEITMTVPFMRAYAELLVKTCHKRQAHAIGGMAAFIPSRKDVSVNEIAFARVREDKLRESKDGFDGTWVAHPDLVPLAKEIFQNALQGHPHQKDKKRDDVEVSAEMLIDFKVPGGHITKEGLQKNTSIALQYLQAWLVGSGAVAIYNLMEDAATAEISRAQLWQWLHHPNAVIENGQQITVELFRSILDDEEKKLSQNSTHSDHLHRLQQAKKLLDGLATNKQFAEFLTLQAYDLID